MGSLPCLMVSKQLTQLGEPSTEGKNGLAVLAKDHSAPRWAPPACNRLQPESEIKAPSCLFTEHSRGPVASRTEHQMSYLVSHWCPESLGLTIPRPLREPGGGRLAGGQL